MCTLRLLIPVLPVLWPGGILDQPSTANLNPSLCQKKKRFLYLGTLGHIHPHIIPQNPNSQRGLNCLIVTVEKTQYTWRVQGWYVMKAHRGVQGFGKVVSQWCHSAREISTLSLAVQNWKYKNMQWYWKDNTFGSQKQVSSPRYSHVIHCQYLPQASMTDISFDLAYSIIVIWSNNYCDGIIITSTFKIH